MSAREIFWTRLCSLLAIIAIIVLLGVNLWQRRGALPNQPQAPVVLDVPSLTTTATAASSNLIKPKSVSAKLLPGKLAQLRSAGTDLSGPLSSFNSCGAGSASGDTYFTIAAVGDLLLHYNIIDT